MQPAVIALLEDSEGILAKDFAVKLCNIYRVQVWSGVG